VTEPAKQAIALRHVHFEDLGVVEDVLRQKGYATRYVDPTLEELDAPSLLEAELLVVLGGPIGAYAEQDYPFLTQEIDILQQRLKREHPTLGICLGAQLIARALGADVIPMRTKEIGFHSIDLTEEGKRSALSALGDVPVLHWHGDQFELPSAAVLLASTAACRHQAFVLGRHILGLQFHIEADVRKIERWLVGHASELSQANVSPQVLRQAARSVEARLAIAARAVFGCWLDAVDSSVKCAQSELTGSPSGSVTLTSD